MGAYIIRRLLISIPVLLGITIIGFMALKLTPGDPLTATLNPEVLANLAQNPEILERERRRLGFDWMRAPASREPSHASRAAQGAHRPPAASPQGPRPLVRRRR